MTNANDGHHLRPDRDDDPKLFLPSFSSIRRRTLDTLRCGDGAPLTPSRLLDKSPKGSVDAPVRSLVDLINLHSSFATLSSCSGRISVFDPNLQSETNHTDLADPGNIVEFEQEVASAQEDERADSLSGSGKGGRGGWLLASHEVLPDAKRLIELLDSDQEPISSPKAHNDRLLSFKMEPMLLHVATATLERGQQLLQVALRSGFRESGLVVTPKRVTVAIRSYSLALSVPLSRRGPLRPPDPYLTELVEEANRRLATNLRRIGALQREIERELFRREPISEPRRPAISSELLSHVQGRSCTVLATRIPDLNLWGQSTVAVADDEFGSVSILSFGGYGAGPQLIDNETYAIDSEAMSARRSSGGRSNEVYRLRRRSGVWSHSWERLERVRWQEGNREIVGIRLRLNPSDFGPREGLTSCIVASPPGETWIALFGGRTSPRCPIGELLVASYSPTLETVAIGKPLDVRGSPPSPRWGHSFTALARKDYDMGVRQLAVLVGGRNETQVLDSMFLLSASQNGVDGSENGSLLWESLVVSSDPPFPGRFHHASTLHSDSVFVFGGLESTSNLLEAFSDTPLSGSPSVFGFSLDFEICPAMARAMVVDVDGVGPCQRRFGHKANVLANGRDEAIVVFTGGVPVSDQEEVLFGPVEVASISPGSRPGMADRNVKIQAIRPVCWTEETNPDDQRGFSIDFGTLVHHDACVVSSHPDGTDNGDAPKALELVVTGGGVPGFGFRPCYGHSFALSVAWTPHPPHASASDADAVREECHREGTPSSRTPHARRSSAGNESWLATMKGSPALSRPEPLSSDDPPVSVAYVSKSDAKRIKSLFQERGWLEVSYRMGPADPSGVCDDFDGGVAGCIAVPLSPSGCLALEQERAATEEWWRSAIAGRGAQRLPRSTRTFARHSGGAPR